MYLGYMASGGNSVSKAAMSSGLDKVLNEIKGGVSLEAAVQKYTGKNLTKPVGRLFAAISSGPSL